MLYYHYRSNKMDVLCICLDRVYKYRKIKSSKEEHRFPQVSFNISNCVPQTSKFNKDILSLTTLVFNCTDSVVFSIGLIQTLLSCHSFYSFSNLAAKSLIITSKVIFSLRTNTLYRCCPPAGLWPTAEYAS